MNGYNVHHTVADNRGERVRIDNRPMSWAEIQALVGKLLLEYGSAKETEPGLIVFKGTYRGADGGMYPHEARVWFDAREWRDAGGDQ